MEKTVDNKLLHSVLITVRAKYLRASNPSKCKLNSVGV